MAKKETYKPKAENIKRLKQYLKKQSNGVDRISGNANK